eukprot:532525-Prymnesium_polylepis.1
MVLTLPLSHASERSVAAAPVLSKTDQTEPAGRRTTARRREDVRAIVELQQRPTDQLLLALLID